MKLLAENSSSFEKYIDQRIEPEASIVCRYRHTVRFADNIAHDRNLKEHLRESSIREGARIVPLMRYRDVEIHILDETSGMATGTLKSIDGCLTTAFCHMEGDKRIAFESGGNTGSALTLYGQKSGMETFFFCPLDNVDLLDGSLFHNPDAHLVGVADRGRVKDLAGLFTSTTGIRHVPEKPWRNAASMFRGLFILEHLLSTATYDWLTQTVSAGFGPIGMYSVLETFRPELHTLPRFLGIQQEANCPMFKAWNPEAAKLLPDDTVSTEQLLTRVMYDAAPQTYRTFEDLQQLLLKTNGDLLTVNGQEFVSYLGGPVHQGEILELLRNRDIAISQRGGDILEKTGLIALVGTLKAIDAGTIRKGSSVLCCLTSGVSTADGQAVPDLTVHDDQDILRYAAMMRGAK